VSFLVPPRASFDELLDSDGVSHQERLRSLRDLRRINYWAGGNRIYRQMLHRLAGDAAGEASILDLGTGTSDTMQAAGSAKGKKLGLDFQLEHLLYGRRFDTTPILRLAGNARAIPLRDASIDIVTSAHFFHHFAPEENVAILDESLRVARIGVAVNDTVRHLAPLAFVRAISALRLVGSATRVDAPASVLQGYSEEEALAVASRTRASRYRVVAAHPYRFAILLWK
jgi:ubiquinone/menaquinone biosynthesis C-methylase UbiE